MEGLFLYVAVNDFRITRSEAEKSKFVERWNTISFYPTDNLTGQTFLATQCLEEGSLEINFDIELIPNALQEGDSEKISIFTGWQDFCSIIREVYAFLRRNPFRNKLAIYDLIGDIKESWSQERIALYGRI